jgi:hypothetical protein
MFGDWTQICDSETFSNATLDPIKELSVVTACQTVINVPCDDADHMHPLIGDMMINEDSVICLAASESQVNKDCTQQLVPIVCSLLQSVE